MAELFQFLELIERLKDLERRGWVLRGVPRPESVGDHMYRMAVMCLAIPGIPDDQRIRAVHMALVHDIGEAIIGDVTPLDGMSKDEKHKHEDLALKFISSIIRKTCPDFSSMLLELWHEFEDGLSETAIFVHQIDKLECMQQAVIYEERTGNDMSDFMNLEKHITLPQLKPLSDVCYTNYHELQSRNKANITIVFISGAPGVGKGTQCSLLAKEFDFHHISVGDLLREESNNIQSSFRDFVKESMEKSVIIPPQLTTQLLKRAMRQAQEQGKQRFFLDGFPRSLDQIFNFELKISKRYSTVVFNCENVNLLQRLQARSSSSGRIDDNPETILHRLETFNEHNTPVLGHLSAHGQLYSVDCNGSVETVYRSACSVVKKILQLQ